MVRTSFLPARRESGVGTGLPWRTARMPTKYDAAAKPAITATTPKPTCPGGVQITGGIAASTHAS